MNAVFLVDNFAVLANTLSSDLPTKIAGHGSAGKFTYIWISLASLK